MDYDVIVIGGGPVGCSVARDIAAAGFKVLVVEEHPRITIRSSFPYFSAKSLILA